MRVCSTLLLVVLFVAHGQSQEATVEPKQFDFDLIPPRATGAIAIRDIGDLKKKALALSTQTSGQLASTLNLGASLGPAVFQSYLGLRSSYVEAGPIGFVFYGKDESYAAIASITNLDDVAKDFKCEKEGLLAGKLIKTRNQQFRQDVWIASRGEHLVVGLQKAVVRSLATGLAKEVQPGTRKAFADDDVILTLNAAQARRLAEEGALSDGSLSDTLDSMLPGVADALAVDSELDRLTLGFRIHDGIETTLVADFDGEISKRLLTKLQNKARQSNLKGLPVGHVVVAGAKSSGPETGDLIQAALNTEKGFSPFLRNVVAPWHVDGLMGILDQGFSRAEVARAAIYRNENGKENGVFCMISVMDTDNGQEFIDEVRKLVPVVNASVNPEGELDDEIDQKVISKMVSFLSHDNQRARKFMMTKLRLLGRHALPELRKATMSDVPLQRSRALQLVREIASDLAKTRADFLAGKIVDQLKPKFGYVAEFEKRENVDVDVVQLALESDDDSVRATLRYMMGPNWNQVRLARVEDQVVLMLGSNTALFDQTLKNLVGGEPGLEAEDHYTQFREQSSGDLVSEFHLSMAEAIAISSDFAPNAISDSKSRTSIGLSISPQSVQLDIHLPIEEINIMNEMWNL